MGFKLLPPILKRATGRPRTRRYKGVEEGGSCRCFTVGFSEGYPEESGYE